MLESIVSIGATVGTAIGVFVVTVPPSLATAGLAALVLLSPFLLGDFFNKYFPMFGKVYSTAVTVPLIVIYTTFELIYGAAIFGGIGGILLAIPVSLIFFAASSFMDFGFLDLYLVAAAIVIFYFRKVISTLVIERLQENFKALRPPLF